MDNWLSTPNQPRRSHQGNKLNGQGQATLLGLTKKISLELACVYVSNIFFFIWRSVRQAGGDTSAMTGKGKLLICYLVHLSVSFRWLPSDWFTDCHGIHADRDVAEICGNAARTLRSQRCILGSGGHKEDGWQRLSAGSPSARNDTPFFFNASLKKHKNNVQQCISHIWYIL